MTSRNGSLLLKDTESLFAATVLVDRDIETSQPNQVHFLFTLKIRLKKKKKKYLMRVFHHIKLFPKYEGRDFYK